MHIEVFLLKTIKFLLNTLNKDAGSSLPGFLLNKIYPHSFDKFVDKLKSRLILVSGTNGKTTTVSLVRYGLDFLKISCFSNDTGANIQSGLLTSLGLNFNLKSQSFLDTGILEVDEQHLRLFKGRSPKVQVFLNIFRDQLDRNTELEKIAAIWKDILSSWSKETVVVLNADDPLIVSLSKCCPGRVIYFGLQAPIFDTSDSTGKLTIGDSMYCPVCGSPLVYSARFFSHFGHWSCSSCQFSRPQPDIFVTSDCLGGGSKIHLPGNTEFSLPELAVVGSHNISNFLAALGVIYAYTNNSSAIKNIDWSNFLPAPFRQEKIQAGATTFNLLLSKNPAGLGQNIQFIKRLPPDILTNSALVFGLNDLYADGRDISWLWDVDFEQLPDCFYRSGVFAFGSRFRELQFCLYNNNIKSEAGFRRFKKILPHLKTYKNVYVLSSYTAMSEVHGILKN